MRQKLLSTSATTFKSLLSVRAISGGPSYFPGLARSGASKAATSASSPPQSSATRGGGVLVGGPAASAARAPSLAALGGRRHSLSDADALAARRFLLHRSSMSDASAARQPLAPGLFVVEGGPAVATPEWSFARTSIAEPAYVAKVE